LTASLRSKGFNVDVLEDASKDGMHRAIDRLKSKIGPDSVVMLFFGGYGVQAGGESYMIPVDAAIWKGSDVRRDGLSIEAVLNVMKERGAGAKLVVIDASRRNAYERRFRTFSRGLAPFNAPDNALILTSTTPGKVADDSRGRNSVLVVEPLNTLNAQAAGAETIFNKTGVAVSRASDGEQVPSVSSSLSADAARLKLNLVVLILQDNAYGMIRWKQATDGYPDFGMTFGNPDFVAYAKAYGINGSRVDSAEGLVPTLEAAFAAGGVQLVAVPVDYSENSRVLVDELRANAAKRGEQT
jgi:hypothetical protein